MPKKASPPQSPTEEKPLPVPRPGTSGTENLLITNRRQASQNFQKAHRAEKAYRAKKRAAAARQDLKNAKDHFKQSLSHFKNGVTTVARVVTAGPFVIGEKMEHRRMLNDEKKRSRALERRKKLEEKLAKETGEGEEGVEAGEASAS